MSDEEMQSLVADVERSLGTAWADAVEQIRDDNTLDAIETAIRSGDMHGAMTGIESAMSTFAGVQQEAFAGAATAAAKDLAEDSGADVSFDAADSSAVRWAKQNEMNLVREVTEEQRSMLRAVHAAGVARGANPREVARDMRGSIGLTDAQAKVVESYRAALEAGQYSDALGRELSDGRSDKTVVAAQRDGRALTSDQIDTMVDRYRANWVAYRAETIARTESLRVTHQGTAEMYRQAIANGDVESDDLEQSWNHAGAGKDSRTGHRKMNGQKRKIGETFTNPFTGAELAYPGDPDADPSETINCRCCVSTRYVG